MTVFNTVYGPWLDEPDDRQAVDDQPETLDLRFRCRAAAGRGLRLRRVTNVTRRHFHGGLQLHTLAVSRAGAVSRARVPACALSGRARRAYS